MSSSDLSEIQANALALVVLLQANAKGKEEDEIKKITYPQTHKDFLNQPFANMTRQSIYTMVDKRMEGGHLYRIDSLNANRRIPRCENYAARSQPPTTQNRLKTH